MHTEGDRRTGPITEGSQEGIFVKELEHALLKGVAELAVHSAKDLPTQITTGLSIAAYLPRADARDALITREGTGLDGLAKQAKVGTGSPRRAAQLATVRPDLQCVPIRGNVDTRLQKLYAGEVEALILAAAGLARLGRLDEAQQLLPFEVMLPAPGQGALAIQAIAGSQAAALAAQLDHPDTRRAVEAERRLLQSLGGGCLSATAAYAEIEGTTLRLTAALPSGNGSPLVRAQSSGKDDARVVAEVVARLSQQGARPARNPTQGGPLEGLHVLVTRPLEQAGNLIRALQDAGAVAIPCPVITIEDLHLPESALSDLDQVHWLVFTSANGADRFVRLLVELGKSWPTQARVAAIGPETAGRLKVHGFRADLVPDDFIAEDLAQRLIAEGVRGRRIVVPRAAGARDVLIDQLKGAGAQVDVLEIYRATTPPNLAGRIRRCLELGVDLITFTSSSTVRHFVEALATPLAPEIQVACIGPITADTARASGLRVDIIAEEYTARGLIAAIVRHRSPSLA